MALIASSTLSPLNVTLQQPVNGSTNASQVWSPLGPLSELITWCGMYALVAIITAIGNGLTLAVFYMQRDKPGIRKCHNNKFLCSLAVADLFVGALCVPMYVTQLISSWGPGHLETSALSNQIFLTMDVFCGMASVFTLCVIALDRFFSVYAPHAHRMASATVYLTALCSPWLLSSFLALVFFLSLLGYLPFKYVYNAVSLSLFTALCVMSAAYAGTGTSLRRSAAKAGRQSARSAANRRKQVKFTKLTLIVTLTFLVSWCPFQILNIVFYVCTIRGMFCTPVISASAVQSVKLLQYASSMANPAIYSFKIPEFRGVIKEKTSLLRARGSTRALKMNQRRDGLELTVES